MKPDRQALLHPMNLAGLFTWGAVALTLNFGPSGQVWMRWVFALLFLVAMMAEHWTRPRSPALVALLVAQALCALALIWLTPAMGVSPVLLVMLVASIATCWPPRMVMPVALLLNIAMYLILRAHGNQYALMIVMIYAAFEIFAVLTSHYASSAEKARDRLVTLNADLLATRALLADASRDAERMRVARDLHDVAGHSLTALTLNLRALATVPGVAERPELATAQLAAATLMQDIRGVVHALRDSRGLDIDTALRALAAPLPRPALDLHIDADVHIHSADLADGLLRIVQEALTNAAKHGDAARLRVVLRQRASRFHLHLEDDGAPPRGSIAPIREGHGLSGMRERVDELGGALRLARTPRGGIAIDVEVPA